MTGILSSVIGSTVKPIATGGTLRSDGTYHYRTFTSNGTFTVSNKALNVSVFVVSGGGGGAGGGQSWSVACQTCEGTCFCCGGIFYTCYYTCNCYWANPSPFYSGAGGGSLTGIFNFTQPIGSTVITIGAGGAGGAGNGNSPAATPTEGATATVNGSAGSNGSASGYGGSYTVGVGFGGQPTLGGANATYAKSSGLGGSGATAGTTTSTGGAGFTDSTYSASSTTYGVGGSSTVTTNSAAAANTGNGGKGGYGSHAANIVNGGSGIVIVRYLKTDVSNNG